MRYIRVWCSRSKKGTHRFDDPVDQPDTSLNFRHIFTRDQAVEVLFRIVSKCLRSGFPFFDASLATNTNFGTTFPFHFLQTVATRSNEETKEVNLRELFDWDVDLLLRTLRPLLLVVLHRRTEVGVILHGFVDELDALVLKLLPVTNLPSVGTTTMSIVRGWRRRGPVANIIVSVLS